MQEMSAKRGAMVGLAMLVGLIAVGTIGFMLIEGWPLLDSLYMTVITISTVGYGDYDISDGGKLFAVFLIVMGLAITAYSFTRLSQAVFEGEIIEILGRRRMQREYDSLSDHYIVCGYGRIGRVVTEGLEREGKAFVVLDQDPEKQPIFRDKGWTFAIGDVLDETLLERVGLARAKTLMALLPSDADNLYLVMTCKTMAPGVTAISRAMDDAAAKHLERGGADRVISTYHIAGQRVLQAALRPALVDFADLWTNTPSQGMEMQDVHVTRGSAVEGQTLMEANVRQRFGVIVVAIRRKGEVTFNPGGDLRLQVGDELIIFGSEEQVAQLTGVCELH